MSVREKEEVGEEALLSFIGGGRFLFIASPPPEA